MKNFFVTLMLSQGVPMLTAGDEFKRTQSGNNNAYCQDNEISWLNWGYAAENRSFLDFVERLIRFRKDHPVFRRGYFFQGKDLGSDGLPDIKWLDENLNLPDWNNADKHVLAFFLDGSAGKNGTKSPDNDFFVIYNAGNMGIRQKIPAPPGKKAWFLAINTFLEGTKSIPPKGEEPPVNGGVILTKPRSSIVLFTKFI